MTTGSWSTMKGTYSSTACSSNSVFRNGTSVTWSGGDSSVKRRPKTTFKERLALFLKSPQALPNGRPVPQKLDANAVAGSVIDGNIFDTARTKRLRTAESSEPSGDYGYPHAFVKTWSTYKEKPFRWYYGDGSYAGVGSISNCGFGNGPSYEQTGWEPQHDYKLLSRMRNKVVGTEFNLASFLGAEGYDTLRFFTDTATRVYRSLAAVRKLDFRTAHLVLTQHGRYRNAPTSSSAGQRWRQQEDVYRDLVESAANKRRGQSWASVPASMWLEYHLAIEPLLGDVVAAAEQLAHITSLPVTQRVQASVTVRRTFKTGMEFGLIHPAAIWLGERIYGKSVVAYFTHTPEPTSFLGFQDPEVVIWNALPLSFVSDYFYDIGGFLEARATARALPTGLYVTTVKNDLKLSRCLGRTRSNGTFVNPIHPPDQDFSQRRAGSISRSVSASYDVPKPLVKPLGAFGNWQRAATVASLIAAFSDRHSGAVRNAWSNRWTTTD